jgi:hypothetical protein
MLNKIILIISILLLALCFNAKSQGGMLGGKITDNSEQKLPLNKVIITDYTNSQSTTTDDFGNYALKVSPGDSVVFTYIGYFSYNYLVPQFAGEKIKNISLIPKKNIIKGVKIIGLTKYQQDSIDRAMYITDALEYEQNTSILNPVTSLYEQFSKKYKDLRKFQKQYAQLEQQNYIDTKYTYELVNEMTKLTGDTAAMFMYKYPMEYNFARTASNLEIKMWIKSNYKNYTALFQKPE